MTTKFLVTGGEYKDTTFKELIIDTEESYGPFDSFVEAKQKWWEGTCKKVDNCHHRLKIIENNI